MLPGCGIIEGYHPSLHATSSAGLVEADGGAGGGKQRVRPVCRRGLLCWARGFPSCVLGLCLAYRAFAGSRGATCGIREAPYARREL
eukprot:10618993-Alexandrium_andersonii.AAC.1